MADVCTCGHALDEHGGDPDFPGSMACTGEMAPDEPCDCCAYEEDEEG